MRIRLGKNAYGKNAVNLSKITRHGDYHHFRQITVDVSLSGDFLTAHTTGDNSQILPTDTQKNTVYALAKTHFTESIEAFAIQLSGHFIANNPQVTGATIRITEHAYQRINTDGNPHPNAFIGQGPEKHTATVHQTRNEIIITSGVRDLLIVKTANSGFEQYIRDAYTTLPETADRIMATQCEAYWQYAMPPADFTMSYHNIRNTILKSFADHHSRSLQHTLYHMGEAVLGSIAEVEEISFKMPNKHHILFNLAPFGVDNNNDIFVATDEPYGLITATIDRGGVDEDASPAKP